MGHPTHPTASSLKCTRRECERPHHMVAGKFAQQLYRLKKCGSATIHSPIPNLLHIRSRTVQIETMRFCNDPSKFPHMFPSSTIRDFVRLTLVLDFERRTRNLYQPIEFAFRPPTPGQSETPVPSDPLFSGGRVLAAAEWRSTCWPASTVRSGHRRRATLSLADASKSEGRADAGALRSSKAFANHQRSQEGHRR